MKIIIYYEYESLILGVHCTYDDECGKRHYDAFSTFAFFKSWVIDEMNNAPVVEITDKNYPELASKGLI